MQFFRKEYNRKGLLLEILLGRNSKGCNCWTNWIGEVKKMFKVVVGLQQRLMKRQGLILRMMM